MEEFTENIYETEIIDTPTEIEEPEPPTKVYIKIDNDNNIIDICSSDFIEDTGGWIKIDEGYGDKYRHAQGQYFDKPVRNSNDTYNYKYINSKVVEVNNG